MKRELRTEVLVIGSGVAGLSVASALGEKNIPTVVVTAAQKVVETNTWWAQGGIIYESSHKDPAMLVKDILEAGCHINFIPAAEQLAYKGPELVRELLLEKVKVPFDRKDSGPGTQEEFDLTREAAHSENRILHKGDESGRSIEESLLRHCEQFSTIKWQTETTVVNLLMTSFHCKDRSKTYEPARCFGAFVFDQKTKEVFPIFADHVVLATGGVGQLYLHNTNSFYSRGDGLALAYRAGARLANLEYVQFHPTTFYHPSSRRFLVSEALRGEGAILINQKGERFLKKYIDDYDTPELAPRDRVAKAIHHEMLSSGESCVFLDISHKPKDWVRERFPFVYRSCLQHGIDITTTPIPVVPGAHYHCGGIWTDLRGQTSVPNLWSVGEAACTGLHGANRLASTSLLEGLVWGNEAAKAIMQKLCDEKAEMPAIDEWKSETDQVDPSFLGQDWNTLKHTMWNYVGLIKNTARLNRADGILGELEKGIDIFYRNAQLSDQLIGLRHATLASRLILEACRRNPRSLGCYQREEGGDLL